MAGDCTWDGEGSGPGPLGIDYVEAYHCGFREHGWLFYPVLLCWGCFITYLSECGSLIDGDGAPFFGVKLPMTHV